VECKGVVWCEVRCDVLWEYGVGSGEREDKQCRRRRALIVQIGAKPEFAKNIRQTWKQRVPDPVLRLLS